MKREIIITDDGSHSLYIPEMDEHYHSTHGAIQESKHIFIEAGLKACIKNEICVFEVGLGTGLNALLSIIASDEIPVKINYISIEKYPLTKEEYSALNYVEQTQFDCKPMFQAIHTCEWNNKIKLTQNFNFTKLIEDITTIDLENLPLFDVVYFDAFAPNKQLGVWDQSIFRKIYEKCNPGGIFVTYCAKGEVRRNLQAVGFKVERLKGPPGKREILRAIK